MNKEDFYIDQIFEDIYPSESIYWCSNNNALIIEIDPIEKNVMETVEIFNERTGEYDQFQNQVRKIVRRFQIKAIPEPTVEELQEEIRDLRNHYLEKYIDPVVSNPFRWADMSQEEQQEYIDYRLYLLNYTKEEDWWKFEPLTMPEWLDHQDESR